MATITEVQEVPQNDYAKYGLTKDLLREMLRKMLIIRKFEEKVEELFIVKGLLIGPSHLYLGQEAIATGAMMVNIDGAFLSLSGMSFAASANLRP